MKKTVLIALSALPIFMYSQASVKKATQHYNNYSYSKVVEKLEDKSQINTDAERRLAESYKMLGDYSKAELLYAKIANAPDKKSEDILAYAQILRMNSKYTEAQTQMDMYSSMFENDLRVKLYQSNKTYAVDLLKDKGQFEVKNLAVNSEQQDFGVAFYKDQVVFASSKQDISAAKRSWNGNNLPYLDLYIGKIDDKNEIISTEKLNKLNKKYHEGPSSYNKDGSIVMYTQDNYKSKSTDGIRKLEMIESRFKDGKWGEKINFPLNNKEYSVGHPSLSADGNRLYFSSDMPGGKGGVDIYRVDRKADGTWGSAENLGDKINTEGNEMFPFIHESGLFFFSSDGRPGLGGLDVFVSQITDNQFSKVVNIGAPINGSKDDFTFVLNAEKTKGYFASNREGGKGDDDLYSFNLLKPFQFGKSIKGTAKDKTGTILANTQVDLKDKNGVVLKTVTTNADGTYSFDVEAGKEFVLNGSKDAYLPGKNTANTLGEEDVVIADVILEKTTSLSLYALVTDAKTKNALDGVKITITDNATGKIIKEFITPTSGDYRKTLAENKIGDQLNYTLKLERDGYLSKTVNFNYKITQPGEIKIHETLDLAMNKLEVGGDLATMIDIKPIYFDLGKFNIRKDAAIELDKIVKVMNDYPKMEVELGSHTDCRASAAFNEKLSDNRAKASAEYIKKSITNPERISGKGYGESKLKNGCACEGTVKSTCTEEEHQQNRRTEFIILKTQ
jgi:outer membrane protein OmpA-like peptidoglycan-associated protein